MSPSFYQALVAEFIGTCILVVYATSFGLPVSDTFHSSVPDINGALGSGFIVRNNFIFKKKKLSQTSTVFEECLVFLFRSRL
jgi:hypothetical protein